MKKIDISTPKHPDTFALVDDEDYERINKYKWTPTNCNHKIYVQRKIYIKGFTDLTLLMHREIMRYVGGKEIDHINGNTLDNRKENLRRCTHSQNSMNKPKPTNNISGYKGVYFSKQKNKWHAEIRKEHKKHHIGFFINKIEAAKAYNQKALELFGEYAHLNIIKEVV